MMLASTRAQKRGDSPRSLGQPAHRPVQAIILHDPPAIAWQLAEPIRAEDDQRSLAARLDRLGVGQVTAGDANQRRVAKLPRHRPADAETLHLLIADHEVVGSGVVAQVRDDLPIAIGGLGAARQ